MSGVVGRMIEVPDGLALFVREWPAIGGESGEPILCLHGLTRNSKDFEDVAPQLAARGRRVLAVDVRGRGLSQYDPQPMRYAPPTYVADVAFILDALGIARAAFVGTSMGGIITMVTAMLTPQRITRAVLNDVGPEIDPRGLARIASYVGKTQAATSWESAAAAIKSINGVAFPTRGDDFFLRMARRTFRQTGPEAFALDYDPEIAAPFRAPGGAAPVDMWPLFESLKPIPTLVVRGALSDLLSQETVTKMKERKPDLETVEVADVGHAPMLDEPDAFAALERFLLQHAIG
jgi:pimeloyl-ACP methyl ester carboxylesterase